MAERLSTGLRNALAGATGFGATMAHGIIEIRSGTQPASADAAASGTLLAIATLNGLPFTPGTATNGLTFSGPTLGVLTGSGVWSYTGIANGTAGHFRFKANGADDGGESTTLPRLDGSCAASGADMNMHTDIKIGETGTITNFSYTVLAT